MAAALSLTVEPTGHFSVACCGGAIALSGGEVRVGNLSSTAKTLRSVGLKKIAGTDALGSWSGLRLSWASAADQQKILMHTTFQQYAADPGVVVFEQEFPSDIVLGGSDSPPSTVQGSCAYDSTAAEDAAAEPRSSTLFPAFERSTADTLPCFVRQLASIPLSSHS